MLSETLTAGILGNTLTKQRVTRAGEATSQYKKKCINCTRSEKKTLSNKWSRSEFVMPPQSLANFEIQKNYQNEPIVNGVYSRNSLSKRRIVNI